jgi:hypothetical protein
MKFFVKIYARHRADPLSMRLRTPKTPHGSGGGLSATPPNNLPSFAGKRNRPTPHPH